jgi:peptide/nickel transport system permease protein
MQRSRFTLLAFTVLGIGYGSAMFAGFLAPYSFDTQNRELSYLAPTRIHMFDRDGSFHFHPFVYRSEPLPDVFGRYKEVTSSRYPIRLLIHGDQHKIFGTVPTRVHLFGVDEPARIFLLGTDVFGRDVFSRLLFGGQISLLSSLTAALIAVVLGMILGGLSGYCGRWADAALMRLSEVFLAMPWLYLLLAVRAALPRYMDPRESYLILALLMGLLGWARPARLARGLVLSLKQSEYVTAAQSFGAGGIYIFRRHIAPSLEGVLLTQLSIYIPQFILAEVTLSFLGLGVTQPAASWGNMLADLQVFVSDPHWWLFAPVVALFVILLAYHGLFAYIKRRTT